MTKSDLIEKVSERVGSLTRKQTEIVVETVFDSIKDCSCQRRKDRDTGVRKFQTEAQKTSPRP